MKVEVRPYWIYGAFNLIVYRHLKTFNIMANYKIEFYCDSGDGTNICCESNDQNQIYISIEKGEVYQTILLDKSTAIKFAKTLRTEINKIQ